MSMREFILSIAKSLSRLRLTLALLVLGVLADNHDFALALDDLALLAHGLHAGTYFHVRSSCLTWNAR